MLKGYLPDLKIVTKRIFWVFSFGIIGFLIYLLVINILAYQYRPENILNRFVSLIENPTQSITDAEKEELKDISQSNFLSSFGNEFNLRLLRRVAQNNPIGVSEISYTGQSRRIASAQLTFQNDYKNPDSKSAKIYLERYGNFWTGYKWRIFQIDLPREDNVLDQTFDQGQKIQEEVQENVNNTWDRIRNFFGL
jgi:hypothetical protein